MRRLQKNEYLVAFSLARNFYTTRYEGYNLVKGEVGGIRVWCWIVGAAEAEVTHVAVKAAGVR